MVIATAKPLLSCDNSDLFLKALQKKKKFNHVTNKALQCLILNNASTACIFLRILLNISSILKNFKSHM